MAEVTTPNADASKDGEAALAGQDLAPGAPFRCIGPGLGMLGEVKERREHAGHVGPVVRIIGLYDQYTASDKCLVYVSE